jgi:hypothetical protein
MGCKGLAGWLGFETPAVLQLTWKHALTAGGHSCQVFAFAAASSSDIGMPRRGAATGHGICQAWYGKGACCANSSTSRCKETSLPCVAYRQAGLALGGAGVVAEERAQHVCGCQSVSAVTPAQREV